MCFVKKRSTVCILAVSLLPCCLSLKCTPSLDNTGAMLIFMLEPEVDVKGNTRLVNSHHSSCQCSHSLVQGKRVCVLTEEMWGLFTYLFQEGERGVSSEQRVLGQMAGICKQQAACELTVDGLFCHLCDNIVHVFLT